MIIKDIFERKYKLGWFRLTKLDSKEYVSRRGLRNLLSAKGWGRLLVLHPSDSRYSYRVGAGYTQSGFEIGCAEFDRETTKLIERWAMPVDFSHF
jgi:hypothetical protein